jgi:hypothetical protein
MFKLRLPDKGKKYHTQPLSHPTADCEIEGPLTRIFKHQINVTHERGWRGVRPPGTDQMVLLSRRLGSVIVWNCRPGSNTVSEHGWTASGDGQRLLFNMLVFATNTPTEAKCIL